MGSGWGGGGGMEGNWEPKTAPPEQELDFREEAVFLGSGDLGLGLGIRC